MGKCTAAQMVADAQYFLGYYEKASSSYAETRDQSAFTKNKGSNNYTYFGYMCGFQGQPWCATFLSTLVLEMCGYDKSVAAEVFRGVWPYYNVTQIDNVPSAYQGKRGSWTPKVGDIFVLYNSALTGRSHTGLVTKVSGSTIYTIEGNTSEMCAEKSYSMSNSRIYGYWRPDYADGDSSTTEGGIELTVDQLSYGSTGAQVKTIQRILYSRGIKGKDGKAITVDGYFQENTEYAAKIAQGELGLDQDGIIGPLSWEAFIKNYN